MTYKEWNPLVRTNFSIDCDIQYKQGFVQTLAFESGKERNYLKNSFVPKIYTQVGLILDNFMKNKNKRTELEEFLFWYEKDTRYGILPFKITRLGFRRKWYTKIDEMGIYKFIPESLVYDSLRKSVLVTFGVEEIGIIPEVEYIFIVTENNEYIMTDENKFLVC